MMAELTLAVDGSTYAGTVALIRGREVIGEGSLPDSGVPSRGQRGEDFMPMVAACMREAGVRPAELSRVVCGSGPGSFTSLRIAASIAKGIAVGVGCPMFSVSSLMLIAAADCVRPGRYLAAIPAMRGESFALEVIVAADVVQSVSSPFLIATETMPEAAQARGAQAIGPETNRPLRPHARGVVRLLDEILLSDPCDIGTWEPDYGRLAEAQVKWEAQHGRRLVPGA